jgi:hypothetical protein
MLARGGGGGGGGVIPMTTTAASSSSSSSSRVSVVVVAVAIIFFRFPILTLAGRRAADAAATVLPRPLFFCDPLNRQGHLRDDLGPAPQ